MMIIHEFTPLWLGIDRIGPFQSRLEEIDFTDGNDESCNLFPFLSQNGRGKTTAMELMVALMGMLGHDTPQQMAAAHSRPIKSLFEFEPLEQGAGRAQWDLRMRYSEDGIERVSVLSLIAGQLGSDTSLRFWDSELLDMVGAKDWHRFGFCRNQAGSWATIGRHDQWVTDFNVTLDAARGEKLGGFEDSTLVWPTVIYFSAYRNVIPVSPEQQRAIVVPHDWNYRPVHAFRTDGGEWRDSLDNLLVWLKWLDDGRFERAIKLLNERVFTKTTTYIKGIKKEPPEAEVVRDGNVHRLDALSSGEKSLVQLFLRIGAHMTRNTILLIDEPEAHLHENWKFRLFFQLKRLLQDCYPGLTVIVATHSDEMMKAFQLEIEEKNLRKGGCFFETPEEEAKAKKIQQEAREQYGQLYEE